jgi:hypothetical protein
VKGAGGAWRCWHGGLERWAGGAVVWSGGSGTVGWRGARGWCRRECWNGEGGGAVAGGAGAGAGGWLDGVKVTDRERKKR